MCVTVQVFFCVVVFGMFHGMMFLPVVLSWIGPKPYLSAQTAHAHHSHQPDDKERGSPPPSKAQNGQPPPSADTNGSSQGGIDNNGVTLEVNKALLLQ